MSHTNHTNIASWDAKSLSFRNFSVNVLFLFFANVALFALMAFKLFGGEKFQRENSEGGTSSVGYFDSFPNSFWQLYVLVTTANSPDVMIPAYERSK